MCKKINEQITNSYRSINSHLPHSPPSLPLPAAPSGHQSFLSTNGTYINHSSGNSLVEQAKHHTLQTRNLHNPFVWNSEDTPCGEGCFSKNCQPVMSANPFTPKGAYNWNLQHQRGCSSNENLSLHGPNMPHNSNQVQIILYGISTR